MLAILRTAVLAILALSMALPASAQRAQRDWVLLGQQEVGFMVDRDIVNVDREGVRFSQLRIEAERNDVYMVSVRLVYQNGYAEDFRVDRELKAGIEALPIDLRGERSYLRKIEMVYRARPDFRGRAVVRIYGELRQGGRPGFAEEPRFEVIDTKSIRRRDREPVVFDLGRDEGRFAKLRFQADNGGIRIREVRITYGNGETQRVTIEDRLDDNQLSRVIDLDGDRRFIRSVQVDARPIRGERDATLKLLAQKDAASPRDRRTSDRGGQRDEWVTLGRQRAAILKADTDVFKVGREMGTFRAIRALVHGPEVRFYSMTIRYGNGSEEEVPLVGVIRGGEASKPFDLQGRDRSIESITFKYRSKLSLAGSGSIEIQGLKHESHRGR